MQSCQNLPSIASIVGRRVEQCCYSRTHCGKSQTEFDPVVVAGGYLPRGKSNFLYISRNIYYGEF